MTMVLPTRSKGKRALSLNPLLIAALEHAAQGRRVLPLHTQICGVCSCGRQQCDFAGKHPLGALSARDASTDVGQILRWWDLYPGANVGLATGPESGLFVLSADETGGVEFLRRLQEDGELPATLRAYTRNTAKEGEWQSVDLYFAYPPSPALSSIHLLGNGINTHGAGSWVVAPPSFHPSGRSYKWDHDDISVAELPDWLIAELTRLLKVGSPIPTGTFLREGERKSAPCRIEGPRYRRGVIPVGRTGRLVGWR
jgi:hypothetical protein